MLQATWIFISDSILIGCIRWASQTIFQWGRHYMWLLPAGRPESCGPRLCRYWLLRCDRSGHDWRKAFQTRPVPIACWCHCTAWPLPSPGIRCTHWWVEKDDMSVCACVTCIYATSYSSNPRRRSWLCTCRLFSTSSYCRSVRLVSIYFLTSNLFVLPLHPAFVAPWPNIDKSFCICCCNILSKQ